MTKDHIPAQSIRKTLPGGKHGMFPATLAILSLCPFGIFGFEEIEQTNIPGEFRQKGDKDLLQIIVLARMATQGGGKRIQLGRKDPVIDIQPKPNQMILLMPHRSSMALDKKTGRFFMNNQAIVLPPNCCNIGTKQ